MAVAFEQIEADFVEMRDFFLNDLDRIVSQQLGGNFAVAALVTNAHEEIAWVRFGQRAGERSFAETLSTRFQPLAGAIYDAARDGLIHGYRTKTIRYDGEQAELGIAWRGDNHDNGELKLPDGQVVDGILLSAPRLVHDLRVAFDRLEAGLREDPELRDRFLTRRRKDRERYVTGSEADAWRELLGGA